MNDLPPVAEPPSAQPPSLGLGGSSGPNLARRERLGLPGWRMLRHYQPGWLVHDLAAGLVLTAVLVPVGMGYAEASGLPAIDGLYATILPLLVYALFGPSRILVLGPDLTLSAVIAALILPLAAGRPERAVALADLLSKPIRIGFMNAIALTVLIGQLPKIFGVPGGEPGQGLLEKSAALLEAVLGGQTQPVSLLIGAGCLALILLLKRYRQPWPGILLAVALATVASAGLGLAQTSGIAVLGALPQGLPALQIPHVTWPDIVKLLPGAAMISLLSFADSSVLSRSLAQRGGYHVSQNQEMMALGAANLAARLFQGFSVSSSVSRTPVAEAAGAKTQVTGLGTQAAQRLAQRGTRRGGDCRLPVLRRPARHVGLVAAAAGGICAVRLQLCRRRLRRRDRGHWHHRFARPDAAGLECLASLLCSTGSRRWPQGLSRRQPPPGEAADSGPGVVSMGCAAVFRQRRNFSRTGPPGDRSGTDTDAPGGGGRRGDC